MKRKINRVGQNTLTVSLPSTWTKKMNLKQGDEIDVIEDNDTLIIGASPRVKRSGIHLDVSGLDSMLNRAVAATYKAGFFSIKISYNSPGELEKIQETIERTFHIFEIMNITEDKLEANAISDIDPKNFDNIYRKIGFCIVEMARDCQEGIRAGNNKMLETVIAKDKIVDRHTDFCRRVLNIGYPIGYEKVCPLYVICEQSEILADIYKVLAKEILDKDLSLASDLQKLFRKINGMVERFYTVVWDFSLEGIKDIGKKEMDIKRDIDMVCSKSRKDIKIICHLHNIFETCFEMKSALLTMHLGQDQNEERII